MVVFVALVVDGEMAPRDVGRRVGVDLLRLVVGRPYLVVFVVGVFAASVRRGRLAVATPVDEQEDNNPEDDDDRYSDAEAYDEQELLHCDAGHRRADVSLEALVVAGHAGRHVSRLVITDRRRRRHRRLRCRRLHRRRRRTPLDSTSGSDRGVRHCPIAVVSVVSGRAFALVSVDAIDARGPVEARGAGALVDVNATVLAGEPWRAVAGEVVDEIVARGSVGARSRGAVVDVRLTERADEAGHAATLEVVDAVAARRAVEARLHRAVVRVIVAVGARVAGPADAAEPVKLVDTSAA